MTLLTPKYVQINSSLSNFNDQPVPSNYYNFLTDDNENSNNITVTTIDNFLPDNKELEDESVPNDDYIDDEIRFGDDDSLASDIDPIQN